MRIVALALCLTAAGSAARAQERPLAQADLPRGVEARLTAIIEDPATRQIKGAATLTEEYAGNVVVFNGPFKLSGKIIGDLIVIDGNVQFEQGAAVTGDVTVVNGEALGLEDAAIDGTIITYSEGFSLFHRGDKVRSVNKRTRRVYSEPDHRDWGHSSLTLRTGWNYNRVEGLPIQFGPVIETGGRNPTRIEALAIWRTEMAGPFETESWGYTVQAEQFLGGHRDLRVGVALRSIIDPIEDWQLTKSEASLATFVLHTDQRDYFQREGWNAYVRYAPRATGFSATVGYTDENHSSQPARDPWTLFDNNDAWRLQPLVAEGSFRSVHAALEHDARNDADFPSSGWLVRGDLTRGLGGTLRLRGAAVDEQFTHGLIDARAYRRVGGNATLSLRFVGGGALGEHALPPQFQHALGGSGSLPGYTLFSADCGARAVPVTRDATSYFPYYGCDRMALVSAEYRGGFDFHLGGFGWDEDDEDDWGWHVDSHPNWVLFFDAGRGWAHAESEERGAVNTGALYDAGGGILIGDIGIYGAVPLTGANRPMKFFVRFGPRF